MENRQRVFIKGVPGRGKEVIKALTDCGGYYSHYTDTGGDKYNTIYFINHYGIIDHANIYEEIASIIMDNYCEIKLPERRWKDGDILFSETDNKFAVFEVEHVHYPYKFFSYLSTCYAGYLTHQLINKKGFRLATESEIEQFYKRLHAINKSWDAEKKQLIDWVWRPSINEAYYTLEIDNGDVVVRTRVYFDDDIDKKLIKNCNFFRTIKEAEEAAERVKRALKGEI